uniref:Uncharacterized protein n=1 Tax=Arundo donax TaxID=35708 RepID=A0A0A9G6I2_ARUDO
MEAINPSHLSATQPSQGAINELLPRTGTLFLPLLRPLSCWQLKE